MPLEGLIEPDLRGVIIVPEPMTDEEFEAEMQRISAALERTLTTCIFAYPVTTYDYEEEHNEA